MPLKKNSVITFNTVHNHVSSLYMRYGASHGKDKKLRDEVLEAVLLKKQVI